MLLRLEVDGGDLGRAAEGHLAVDEVFPRHFKLEAEAGLLEARLVLDTAHGDEVLGGDLLGWGRGEREGYLG